MEFLNLVKETKSLNKYIKRQEEEFNLKIKEKVETLNSNKEEIRKYLKEAINSREYEYKEVEVKSVSSFGTGMRTTYYPFLKIDDEYEVKEESFVDYGEDDDYYGLHRKYIIYNKNNGIKIKVKEHSLIRKYERGTNKDWERFYPFGVELINASRHVSYEVEIEEMKFEFNRSFDVSKV